MHTDSSDEVYAVQTIALLLQHCSQARQSAVAAELFDDLLTELDTVLDSLNGVTCSDLMRRSSEAKRTSILRSMRQNITIMFRWFSKTCLHGSGMLLPQLSRFARLAANLWPWITGCGDHRLLVDFLYMLVYACDDSLPMCKLFANGHRRTASVLQLCANYVTTETQRPKKPNADLKTMDLAMRVLANCCAAVEGRQVLLKMNFLNAMDRLHPTVTKYQRPWPKVTLLWLRFYEILTRHETNDMGVK